MFDIKKAFYRVWQNGLIIRCTNLKDCVQKASASGRIPLNFLLRDSSVSNNEILISRMIGECVKLNKFLKQIDLSDLYYRLDFSKISFIQL
jgi:hypothetical protein